MNGFTLSDETILLRPTSTPCHVNSCCCCCRCYGDAVYRQRSSGRYCDRSRPSVRLSVRSFVCLFPLCLLNQLISDLWVFACAWVMAVAWLGLKSRSYVKVNVKVMVSVRMRVRVMCPCGEGQRHRPSPVRVGVVTWSDWPRSSI